MNQKSHAEHLKNHNDFLIAIIFVKWIGFEIKFQKIGKFIKIIFFLKK